MSRAHLLGGWVLALSLAALPARGAEPEDLDLSKAKGEAKARMQNIDQSLQDWDLEGAKRELAALETLAPAEVEPLRYYRGRIAFEEGRYAAAVEDLEQAGIGDKPGSWLRLARDTQAIVGAHVRVESEHFVLLHPAGKDAVLAPYALEALEKARTALEQDLGWAPPGKTRVELVATAADLSKTSTLSREAIRTTGTIAICKFNKLIVTSPRALIHGYDWLDTLAHEYIHLVVGQRSRNTVPIWMHEGLAKYLESRWRGPAGGAMTPSTLALLGSRVRKNTLVPFEKMHPSMALLPTAEDAATAFAEVFFAMDLISREGGPGAFKTLLEQMSNGHTDRQAVEAAVRRKWPEFERAWMAHLKKQPFPKELIPASAHEKKELAENAPTKAKQEKESERKVSFGDFAEVAEPDARRAAHLGELFRERSRMGAAAEHYERAWKQVGDRYESVSNKYALTLLELRRFDEAEKVLLGSLTMHPGSGQTNVHLARLGLRKKAWGKVREAALGAIAVDPFDPEVHLALYRAAEGLGDGALQARAKEAVVVLLKVKPEHVGEIAAALARDEDLVSAKLPVPAAPGDGGAR